MKCVDRYSVVWIGVVPVVLHGSVVHGQQLDYLHPVGGSPVGHQFKVAKVAHSTRSLAAHHHSCRLPQFLPSAHNTSVEHPHLPVGHTIEIGFTVVAFLPILQAVGLFIHYHIFIFYWLVHHLDVNGHCPYRLTCILHGHISR